VVFALTAGLLVLFLRNANLAAISSEIARADTRWLALALLAASSAYVLRARRWQFLLWPIGPTRFATALSATAIGFAASFLIPRPPGEVIRPFLLGRRERLNTIPTLATIAVERVLDLIGVLILFAVVVPWTPQYAAARAHGTGFPLMSISSVMAPI